MLWLKWLGKLVFDWGSLIAIISGVIAITMFLGNILTVNQTQATQIGTVTSDVDALKHSIPAIQRSLGRIEGRLGIYQRDN